jgi:hypothetical protein
MRKLLNIKGIIHAVSITLNPWIYLLFGVIFNKKIFITSTTTNNIIFMLFFIVSTLSFFITSNFSAIIQMLAFYFYLNISIKKSNYINTNKNQLVYYLRIYMFLGFILAMSSFYFQGQRLGLFGSEINFTGFMILIYIHIIKSNDKLKLLDYIIWISFIFITGSRAFLFMSITSIFYYYYSKRKTLLNFVTIFFIVFFIFFESFIGSLTYLPIFKQTGYIDDYSRLYQLYDSSSITRFNIINDYVIHFKNNLINFFFGNSKSQLENNLMESHNSFFQKIYEYGLISTIFLIYIMRKKMEVWIFSLIIIYGFFLHNLFSIPLLIFILLYEKKNNNNYSNLQ